MTMQSAMMKTIPIATAAKPRIVEYVSGDLLTDQQRGQRNRSAGEGIGRGVGAERLPKRRIIVPRIEGNRTGNATRRQY